MKKLFLFFLTVLSMGNSHNKEFLEIANQLSQDISKKNKISYSWMTMLPNFLSENKIKTINISEINTPDKYYLQRPESRKKLLKDNPKLKLIEKYFSKSEHLSLDKSIAHKKTALQRMKKNITIDQIKEAVASFHYKQAEINPDALDLILGINYEEVENEIVLSKQNDSAQDAFIGSFKERSQTPYTSLQKVFEQIRLKEEDVFYDLGSGYGRVALYGGILNPKIKFFGVEIIKKRADHANRIARELQINNVKFIADNVLNVDLETGTIFYMYNPFPSVMKEVLTKLKKISKKKKIQIIGRGITASELEYVDWLIKKDSLETNDNIRLSVFASIQE